MVNRIDIFMPPTSQYGVLPYLTNEIHQAFIRQGVTCKLLVAERENPEPFLKSIFSDPPDCTFSINGLLPDEGGQFFCDMIKIPHVACLTENYTEFGVLTQSPLNILTSPDAFGCHYFRGLGCEQALFMPHGVSPALKPDPSLSKKYDVLFVGSCIDYEYIRGEWKKKYPKQIYQALEHAQEITLSDYKTNFMDALVQAINEATEKEQLNLENLNMLELIQELELFVKGRDRVELIKSIKDAQVTIFGATIGVNGWDTYLKGIKNVKIHSPIPFESAIEAMKMSKIVLNSSPASKNGAHDRIFAALGTESFLLTSQNIFMDHHFVNGQDLAYYIHGEWADVNEIVQFYLANDAERLAAAKNGRDKAMAEHTWDRRVEDLLRQLPPLIEKAKATLV